VLGAAVVACSLYALPQRGRNPLVETTVWSLLVLVAFGGWGSLVRWVVAPRERVDLGLRVVWGAALLCVLGGTLMVPALMRRATALVLVEVGVALALVFLARERSAVHRAWRLLSVGSKRAQGLAVASLAIAALVGVHYVAGVADWHINPYDDEIAYLSFVQKLLDTGTVLEPFSLRRLAALGGQTFFQELVAIRATAAQGMTFDRSVCLVMIVLLVLGYRRSGKRTGPLFALSAIVLFVTLPIAGINTASYYSGVAFFLGLFRTVTWLGRAERAPWKNALVVALVGATICTLRQNYLVVPAFTLGFSYVARFWRTREWREAILAGAFSVALLAPWLAVAWQSNQTFLYPVVPGTANPALDFRSSATTFWDEARLLFSCVLDGMPMKTVFVFFFAAALVRERDPRRPLASLVFGSCVGLVALVHGTTQGDGDTLARYAFGFLIAGAIAVILVASTERFALRPSRALAFVGITALAIVVTIVDSRPRLSFTYARHFRNIDALGRSVPRSLETRPPEAKLYEQLQGTVPPGERLAILLDEPYHLDYARNPIWNLDMPGYSSLPPGIPFFQGSAKIEEYFRNLGVRYMAFVRPDHSRYHYRREYWIERINDEQEVWRIHAPYLIDFLDALDEMSRRHKKIFDWRGLVMMDLERPSTEEGKP
jgi:hypothetical protein